MILFKIFSTNDSHVLFDFYPRDLSIVSLVLAMVYPGELWVQQNSVCRQQEIILCRGNVIWHTIFFKNYILWACVIVRKKLPTKNPMLIACRFVCQLYFWNSTSSWFTVYSWFILVFNFSGEKFFCFWLTGIDL